MEFPLRPQYFRQAMLIQQIAFAAFMSYRQDPKTCAMVVKGYVSRLVKAMARAGEPFECDIVFDETIWPPDTDRHGAVMRVHLALEPTPKFYIFEFDFRRPIREGIAIIGDGRGHCLVDVFDVMFVGDLPERE